MSFINCKTQLELNWTKNCVMSNVEGNTVFKITNTKVICPQVTFFTKDNVKLTKQINERPVYWNEYKTKIESRNLNNDNLTRFYLDASFQRVKKMFVLAFDNTDGANKVERNSHKKYFLAIVDITKYNVLTDGRTFYDQPITDQILKTDEIREVEIGKRNDYTTGYLWDYISKIIILIAVDLSKQEELDTDPRAVQQFKFYGMLRTHKYVQF